MAALQTDSKCSHTNVYAPLSNRFAPCPERLDALLRWVLTLVRKTNALLAKNI